MALTGATKNHGTEFEVKERRDRPSPQCNDPLLNPEACSAVPLKNHELRVLSQSILFLANYPLELLFLYLMFINININIFTII